MTYAVESNFELDDIDHAIITGLFAKLGPKPTQVGRRIIIGVTRGMSEIGEPCLKIEVVYDPKDKR